MTYDEAVAEARRLMAEGGDDESLRLAVGEAIRTAPKGAERAYWRSVSKALAGGKTKFRTKERSR